MINKCLITPKLVNTYNDKTSFKEIYVIFINSKLLYTIQKTIFDQDFYIGVYNNLDPSF